MCKSDVLNWFAELIFRTIVKISMKSWWKTNGKSTKKYQKYILKQFGDILGQFVDILGQFGDILGQFGDILGQFGDILGQFGNILGLGWAGLGCWGLPQTATELSKLSPDTTYIIHICITEWDYSKSTASGAKNHPVYTIYTLGVATDNFFSKFFPDTFISLYF